MRRPRSAGVSKISAEIMEKAYEPRGIEDRWYGTWESQGWFKPEGSGAPYCILLPPPNVTGTLHMGHAFQQTLMDIADPLPPHARRARAVAGRHRPRGHRHPEDRGEPAAAEGQTRHDLGREKFVERVWEWKEESGSTITRQMRRLGASVDWSRERFTMDEGLSAAVRNACSCGGIGEGCIYRGKRLVNWDPVLRRRSPISK